MATTWLKMFLKVFFQLVASDPRMSLPLPPAQEWPPLDVSTDCPGAGSGLFFQVPENFLEKPFVPPPQGHRTKPRDTPFPLEAVLGHDQRTPHLAQLRPPATPPGLGLCGPSLLTQRGPSHRGSVLPSLGGAQLSSAADTVLPDPGAQGATGHVPKPGRPLCQQPTHQEVPEPHGTALAPPCSETILPPGRGGHGHPGCWVCCRFPAEEGLGWDSSRGHLVPKGFLK